LNKAFVRDSDDADDEDDSLEGQQILAPGERPAQLKNYMTPAGYARMKAEFLQLMDVDRPEVVRTVTWAASNGDRSENGDYLYGKKRLREIDRRIRFLTKRLDIAIVVDSTVQQGSDQVFFGATVKFLRNDSDVEETVTIVGIDEVDPMERKVSWISPVAKVLIKAKIGDVVQLRTPAGVDELEVTEVNYPSSMATGA
jgi:transcription elongation factor GreB